MTHLMISKAKIILTLLSIAILAGCPKPAPEVPQPVAKPTLEFRNLRVVEVRADAKTRSTRVRVSFEVFSAGKTISGLSEKNFWAFEDGIPATSESLTNAIAEDIRVPVILLLDTSLSMYEAGAVAELKQAASRFIERLEPEGYAVRIMKFDTDVKLVKSVNSISDSSEGRWTSLYAAIDQALRENEKAIIVVFSDGADNYSQNHGVASLEDVEQQIGDRTVHAIGFGNLQNEYDRQGVSASEALRRLTRNGSIAVAAEATDFDRVFSDLSDRLRSVYLFDYFSPNLSGDHTLEIQVSYGGQTARTSPIKFSGAEAEFQRQAEAEQRQKAEGQRRRAEAERQRAKHERILAHVNEQMVRVPGGTFTMGCTPEQADCDNAEKPAHQVQVRSFNLSKYEVTQELWEAVMGKNRSKFKPCPQCPVEQVSWDDIQAFLKKLNAGGGRYRLPSEAEWEYAARGGAQSQGYKYAGSNNPDAVAWHSGNSGRKTHPVGQKQANELGLYDMSGNVSEWVQDCWNDNYQGAPSDGRAWETGDCRRRILRGKDWLNHPIHLRSARRDWSTTADNQVSSINGFRIAQSLP